MTIDLSTEPRAVGHDEIACRAYELYVARGCEDGCDFEDWLTAEAQLLRETSPTQQSAGTEKRRPRGSAKEGN